MPFKDGQDLNELLSHPIDEPIISFEDFADVIIRDFRYDTAALGELLKRLASIDDPAQQLRRGYRIVLREVFFDLGEPLECLLRPPDFHGFARRSANRPRRVRVSIVRPASASARPSATD